MSASSLEGNERLCRDCKHFRPHTYKFIFWTLRGDPTFSRCAAMPNLVTGEAKAFCDLEREYGDKCGKEGKLWQSVVT